MAHASHAIINSPNQTPNQPPNQPSSQGPNSISSRTTILLDDICLLPDQLPSLHEWLKQHRNITDAMNEVVEMIRRAETIRRNNEEKISTPRLYIKSPGDAAALREGGESSRRDAQV